MRGSIGRLGLAESPPHPNRIWRCDPTSPLRGEVNILSTPACLVPQNIFQGKHATIASRRNLRNPLALFVQFKFKEADMGFGRGALLWLIGIPLPIILLLALFMHH